MKNIELQLAPINFGAFHPLFLSDFMSCKTVKESGKYILVLWDFANKDLFRIVRTGESARRSMPGSSPPSLRASLICPR